MRDEWPRAYPEDWQHWIRDENGNRVPATGYPAFLMDFTHPEVQDIIVEQAIAVRKCGLYDGIFLDWWNEKGTVLWTDFTKPTRTNAAEQAARDVIIRRIRAGVGEDFLIIVNHNRQKAERAGPYINGLFMETLRDNENGYTRDGLIKIESTLLWAEENLREPRINCLEGGAWSLNPRRLRITVDGCGPLRHFHSPIQTGMCSSTTDTTIPTTTTTFGMPSSDTLSVREPCCIKPQKAFLSTAYSFVSLKTGGRCITVLARKGGSSSRRRSPGLRQVSKTNAGT